MTTELSRVDTGAIDTPAQIARGGFADHAFARGYQPPESMKETIKAAHRTSLVRTVGAVMSDYALAIGPLVAAVYVWRTAPAAIAIACSIVGALIAARGQRGLEALVHEASHGNWSRRSTALNDRLASVLAAAPMIADLGAYRVAHRLHHTRYGTIDDVDRRRYVDLRLDDLDRSSAMKYTRGMFHRLPMYWTGWMKSVGVGLGVAIRFVLWWAVLVAVTSAAARSWATGVFVGVAWLVVMTVFLPILRFIGESAEHVYLEGSTIFGTTVSNIGRLHKLGLHPHGDGYHAVHHLWPGIPHHAIARIHRLLLVADADGFAKAVLVRKSVVSDANSGTLGIANICASDARFTPS